MNLDNHSNDVSIIQPIYNNCTFENNVSDNHGGVVVNTTAALKPIFENCIFKNNSAFKGGVISNVKGTPTINNCRFENNTAGQGGAIRNLYNCSPIIDRCVFINNTATEGGAVYDSVAYSRITNSLFANNTASNGAGLYRLYSSDNGVLTNCTFINNNSSSSSALYNYDSNTLIANSIMRGSGTMIYSYGSFTPLVQYSNIQGGYSGTGNIDADPIMVDPSGDNYRLSCGSPCLNVGNNGALFIGSKDLDGFDRIQSGTVDMGAYEGEYTGPRSNLAGSYQEDTKNQQGLIYYGYCNNLIASLQSTGSNPITGNTTAKIWVEPNNPILFVKRHYEITPASNASDATGRVTLYFTQSEFDEYNYVNTGNLLPYYPSGMGYISNLKVIKYPGISSNNSGLPNSYSSNPEVIDPDDNDVVWNDLLARWEVSFETTGFSGFFVTTQTALPINWLHVDCRLNVQKQAVLSWEVEESNVSFYIPELSTDGKNFISMSTIPSKGNGKNKYLYTDHDQLTQTTYFRVKQVDFDGSLSYSKLVSLSVHTNEDIKIFPNLVDENINLIVGNKYINSKGGIYNSLGIKVSHFYITDEKTTINVSLLSPGIYFLVVNEEKVMRFVKK